MPAKSKRPSGVPVTHPRDRLLDAATRLFCRHGINATGIDLVVSEAGTAKTTLYNAFGSKEGLVEAVLEGEGRRWRDWFFAALDNPGLPPRARLHLIFPALEDWFGQDDYFGCAFINAVAEHDKSEERLRGITLHHKRLVLGRIEEIAAEAGCARPADLAHQLGIIMDGAIVAAMVTRDRSVAVAAGQAAVALIDAVVPLAAPTQPIAHPKASRKRRGLEAAAT